MATAVLSINDPQVASLISNIRFEHTLQIDELNEKHKKRIEALHCDLSKARIEKRDLIDQCEAKMMGLRRELAQAYEVIKHERAMNAGHVRKLKAYAKVEHWLMKKIAEAAP